MSEIEVLTNERDNALLEAERWKRELLRKIEDCGCDGQAYLDIRAERDAARVEVEKLKQRNLDLDDERSRTLDNARLHEAERDAALMRVEEAQAAVAAMTVEIADLRAHILDIDAHATPYGDLPEDPGYVGTYLLTSGALHRALGRIGHGSPSCTAEADLRALHEKCRGLVELHDRCDGCSITDELREFIPDPVTTDVGERSAVTTAGEVP